MFAVSTNNELRYFRVEYYTKPVVEFSFLEETDAIYGRNFWLHNTLVSLCITFNQNSLSAELAREILRDVSTLIENI